MSDTRIEVIEKSRTWLDTLGLFLRKEVITMLFLGFSAGIPILLIFSSLSLWLGEAGVERSTVTYFSWAALAYSFKFLWSPLIDRLPIPFLTSWLGRRRGWILLSQILVMTAIVLMGSVDPSKGESQLTYMALAVVMLGFSSATQDTVIDAYRIEVVEPDLQALVASTYIAGYRVGMIVAGAGALILAQTLGSSVENYHYFAWQSTYYIMALVMLVGVTTTLMISEPLQSKVALTKFSDKQYLKFLSLFLLGAVVFVFVYTEWPRLLESLYYDNFEVKNVIKNNILENLALEILRLSVCLVCVAFVLFLLSRTAFYERQLVEETYIRPIEDFFSRYGLRVAFLILLFVGFYRISDIVLGVIALIFYQDMGYSKIEIAAATKTFGLIMTLAGGFLGGILSVKYGVMRILFLGAVLTIVTNLLFVLLAQSGHDIVFLYVVISADNISGGLASAAFISYLASLTNISFTAVQYAIFSSLMTLIPKTIGGYSGSMVDSIGYENFFLIASAMGLPVLVILYFVNKHT